MNSRKDMSKIKRQDSERMSSGAEIQFMLHNSGFDRILLFTVGFLLMLGLLMVYSASNVISHEYFQDSYYFFKRQMLSCCMGLIAMTFTMFFDYRNYHRLAFPLIVLSGFLLMIVYIPGLGMEHGGGTRWVKIGGFSFQPVELAKLSIVIYIAQFMTRKIDYLRDFRRGLMPSLFVLMIFFILIGRQPDFGSLILIGSVTFVMFFIGGIRVYQIAALLIAAGLLVYAGISSSPYRLKRWTAFLDPWKDPNGVGYHIIQSFYALGSGGIIGTGLGAGMQKLHYLPTPHNDFIFAVIGEELGFIGTLIIVLAFMAIVWRGIRISLSTSDRFGSLLAIGISSLIGIQAFINIGVVTGSLPTKGITLPFISFGGSSMLISLASVGILLNISSAKKAEKEI
jgi:cell division protein FtsW